MDKYLEMLTFMRPAFNPYDDAFVARYIDVLDPNVDSYGNRWLDVGEEPTIIWSSHTDTVHDRGGFQEIVVDKNHIARLAPKQRDSNCLGADCTTGVWLMVEMIEAGIPGRYIFHRNEENGGLGSRWIVQNTPELLRGISAAIAFDRKGTSDVITEQGVPTASDAFARSLAKILGGGYRPSPNGAFTDTKVYRKLVPECTNISVGYSKAHSSREAQDLKHLKWLRDVLCQIDLGALVIERDPSTPDPVYHYGYRGTVKNPTNIEELCRTYPITLARVLEQQGFTFEELHAAIYDAITERTSYAA